MRPSRWHSLKNYLVAVTAILSIVNGLAYLFFPGLSTGALGVRPDSYGMHITRYYGACALGYGLLLWWLRKNETYRVSRALLLSITIILGISVIVGVLGLVNGVTNWVGWLFVVVDLLLTSGSLALLWISREN